jgi:GNAT superfamily N-acetyltransferase
VIEIRPPRDADEIARMVVIADYMHGLTNFASVRFDQEKVYHQIEVMVADPSKWYCKAAVKDGVIIGGMLGFVSEAYYSQDKIAFEMTVMVLPEHRGSRSAWLLIKDFTAWAEQAGAKQIRVGVGTGPQGYGASRIYGKLGYETSGFTHVRHVCTESSNTYSLS